MSLKKKMNAIKALHEQVKELNSTVENLSVDYMLKEIISFEPQYIQQVALYKEH